VTAEKNVDNYEGRLNAYLKRLEIENLSLNDLSLRHPAYCPKRGK